MKMKYLWLFAAAAIWWSVPAQSAESKLCKQGLTKPSYLQSVGTAAEKAKKEICSAESQAEMDFAYVDFLYAIKNWFNPYGGFEGGKSVIEAIGKVQITTASPSVAISLNLNDEIQVERDSFKPADETKCVQVSGAQSCTEVLEDFIQLYVEVQNLQAEPERVITLRNLGKLRADWEPFLERMKGQTWLELLINGQAYRNNSDTFSGPPSRQWIVLHPTVLIENVTAAADGENTQEALGLEVIGMNWWKQDKWYFPSGGSVLAVYSDRKDIKDVGWGLALHFQSNYTFGFTKHGGDDGIFVSVDVIKLFQDKKKVFQSYRSAFD